MDSALYSPCGCEELSLLISLYGRSARLVIGGYAADRSGEAKQQGAFFSLPRDLKMGKVTFERVRYAWQIVLLYIAALVPYARKLTSYGIRPILAIASGIWAALYVVSLAWI